MQPDDKATEFPSLLGVDDPFSDVELDQLFHEIGQTDRVTSPAELTSRIRQLSRQELTERPSVLKELPSQIGAYEIVQHLGIGGMGSVYRGRHAVLGSEAAIKTIRQDRVLSHSSTRRFYREMRSLAALNHPNVVRALDGGESNGLLFLVMELITGKNLKQVMDEKVLSLPLCCEWIRQAAVGLDAIHKQGILHRDIKPANIMLTQDNTIKLVDFGLALVTGDDGDLTGVRTVIGTERYISPEQRAGLPDVDHRCDVYSLGRTFQDLLQAIVSRVASDSFGSSVVPTDLQALAKEMVREDRELRIQQASEVAARLAPFCPSGQQLPTLAELPNRNPPSAESDAAPPASKSPDSLTCDVGSKQSSTGKQTSVPTSVPTTTGSKKRWLPTVIMVAGLATIMLIVAIVIQFQWPQDATGSNDSPVVPAASSPMPQFEATEPVAGHSEATIRRDSETEAATAAWLIDQGAELTVNIETSSGWKGMKPKHSDEIRNCTCVVQNVQLHGLTFNNAHFEKVLTLSDLQGLMSDNANITDDFVKRMNPNWGMKWLYIPNSTLTDAALVDLAKYQKTLESLDLSRTQVTGSALPLLTSFPKLRELILNDITLKDTDLECLPEFPSLVSFEASHTAITDAVASSLAECHNLRKLNLSQTSVTDQLLEVVSDLPLTFLNVSQTQVSADAVARLRERNPLCTVTHQ